MRIFELARELKTSAGDLLRIAQQLDLEATSTLSQLDSDEARRLKRHFVKLAPDERQADSALQEKLAAKRTRAAARLASRAAAEREKLAATIERAKSAEALLRAKELEEAVTLGGVPEAAAQETAVAVDEPVASRAATVDEEVVVTIAPPAPESPKVIIHAEGAITSAESAKEEAAQEPAADFVDDDDFDDGDEELAEVYLGRRAQAPQPAKATSMRARSGRDADQPAVAPRGGKAPARRATAPEPPAATAAAGRGAARGSAKKGRGTDKQPPARGAAAKAGRGTTEKTGRGTAEKGGRGGLQPIVRGITAGTSTIPRGTAAAAAAENPRFAPVVATTTSSDKLLQLRGPTLVKDLAEMMGIRPNRLIADLMQLNVLVSINQRVDLERAGTIAAKYGYTVELERTKRSAARRPAIKRLDEEDDIPDDQPEDMKPRPPVVTFLGHVDHGKTSLMDRIRQAQVASGEAGGITQHIGAYSVELAGRKITFLDTPGHAAFAAMRARGANLTDIAVIIIAADDGIMPQTREVIKQAQQSGVQLMVAINKCDLPTAKPDRVRQQLQGEGLTPEEWGGDLVVCEVSAHTGDGIEHLLEMILLQADMLELEANPNRRADGYVIEAQLELGRGPTASLLVTSGTLKAGDVVLIGEHFGRLRGLMDDRGRKILKAGPATAVSVMGLSGVPEAGAEFRVMVNEKRARELAEKFAQERKESELTAAATRSVSMDDLFSKLSEQQKKQLNLIIKGDTQGSIEAIVDSLKEMRSEKITLDIIHTGVGNVSTNDVQRAAAGTALLVGFQVGLDNGVAALARRDGVRVQTFRIIYELFEHVKQAMFDLIDPEYREVVKGHAQIRAIFDIGGRGRIAGCQLLDGTIGAKLFVRIKRGRDVVYDGRIASLRHFQDEVDEVRDLQECGIFFDKFEAFEEGDIVECYAMEEMEKTL